MEIGNVMGTQEDKSASKGDNVGLSWGLDHCASLIGDGHHWPPSDDDLAVRVQSTHITTINGSYA